MRCYGYLVGAGQAISGRHIEVSEERLHEVLRIMLALVYVDEAWYRGNHPDVDAAIEAGDLPSARAHYIRSGYFEDRQPHHIEVDENWYLAEYPDVAEAVANGVFDSAQQHFSSSGFREGRIPFPGWQLVKLGGDESAS